MSNARSFRKEGSRLSPGSVLGCDLPTVSLRERLIAKYDNGERLLTGTEVGAICKMTESNLAKWRMEGAGPKFLNFGRGRSSRISYRLEDVLDYLDSLVLRSTSDQGITE